jgi:hypothetical protein
MEYKEILDLLIKNKLINSDGKISPWLDRKISQAHKDIIVDATKFLTREVDKLFYRIRAIQLNILSEPICQRDGCENPTCYAPSKFNFLEYCSTECSNICDKVKTKRTNTNMELFGVTTKLLLRTKEERSITAKNASAAGRVAVLEKYGVTNVMFVKAVKDKHYINTTSEEAKQKKHETVISRFGSYSNLADIRDKKLGWGVYNTEKEAKNDYIRLARNYSNKNDLTLLDNHEFRTRIDLSPDAYNLDHKFSMTSGFNNNIHPSIIGNKHNLEFIPALDNILKQDNNSIELGTLLALIETDGINITLEQFKQLSGVK